MGCNLRSVSILPVLVLGACSEGAPEGPHYAVSTDPSGCRVEQITTADFHEFHFHGAGPKGRYLSVGWNKGEDADGNPIRGSYILDLETGAAQELSDPMNHNSAFSPDGRRLIGAMYVPDARTELYEMDLGSGQTRVVASHEQWEFKPSYSPDGESVLFSSYRTGRSDIYILEQSSGNLRRLTEFDGYDAHGEFSPDGTKVLFHRQMSESESEERYDFDLFSIDLETGAETRLTFGPFEESYPSWAPDGEHIVFSSDFEEAAHKSNLYVLGPDGEILRGLTKGNWADSYAFWTRDGAYIYFNSDRSGVTDIYRMPMNGLDCVRAS